MHGPARTRVSLNARTRARELDGNAELDPAANVRPGYDCVTLTRGAAALAVVANTLAVATSFPSKSPSPGRRTGCSMGRCHAKPDCRDSPGGALLTGGSPLAHDEMAEALAPRLRRWPRFMNRDYSRHFVEDFFAKSGATRPSTRRYGRRPGQACPQHDHGLGARATHRARSAQPPPRGPH